MTWQNGDNLNITTLTEPEPLFHAGCPAGKVYLLDDDQDGEKEMFVLNAYGDMDGLLESQLYTGANCSTPSFHKRHQGTCNRVSIFRKKGVLPWKDGLSRPNFEPSGSLTLNVTGCISDIDVSKWLEGSS